MPSWSGDSRHVLYQSMDKLRIVDVETGDIRTVPLDLKYTPAIPTTRLLVHAGKLVDMKSAASRANVDIVIEGNKITSVVPHAEANHTGQVVDASNLTVMPGLIEFHSHLQPDFGESAGRAWLAFGITTVRSPGNTPYEPVEEREASEANVRIGPRVYGTGNLMEWQRVYYKMGIAISGPAHFELELQRAKVLQYDMLKSYVRLPDLQQKRMVEFAHSIGIPVATHEIFPASFVGVDNTEHTSATSRRGYSPKMATLQRSYEDVDPAVRQERPLPDADDVRRARQLFEQEPELKNDPRFKLYPEWMQQQVAQMANLAAPNQGVDPTGNGKMVMDVMHAGGGHRRRHRHAERDQPARRDRRLRRGRHDPLRGAEGGDGEPGAGARARRRHDRGRQARRSHHGRRRSAGERRERAQGAPRDRQRPSLRDGAVDQSRDGVQAVDSGSFR